MLIDIRKRAATFGWIIIGPLILMFALWGISNYLDNPATEVVASGGDVEVTLSAYRQRLESETRNLQQQYGAQADLIIGQPQFKTNLARSMLIERLFDARVDALGLDASDQQVRDQLLADERFQRDGQFDRDRYQQSLARFGTSPDVYENQVLRRRIAQQQLVSGIAETSALSEGQLQQAWSDFGQLRTLHYVTLDADRFSDEVVLEDGDLEQVWQSNQERFEVPQRARLAYVELDRDQLADQQIVDDAEIASYYERNRDAFTEGPESRQASHILLTVSADRDDAATLALAESLIDRLNASESFADLATEYSADVVSVSNGGSLGEVNRGDTAEPFETALWAMRANGELSAPIQSDFGYHIIRLDQDVTVIERSLDEVRDQIQVTLGLQKAERAYAQLLEDAANVAYEQSESLLPVGDLVGADPKISEWFSREEGVGIASNELVRAAAFSEDVKDRAYNSEVIELSDTRSVVVRLEEMDEAHVRALDEVRDQVSQMAIIEKSTALAVAQGSAALAELEAGDAGLDAIADRFALDVTEVRWTGQSPAIGSDAELRDAAFAIGSESSLPKPFGVAATNGGYLLAELTEIEQPVVPDADSADVDALLSGEYQQLQTLYNDYLGASLLGALGRAVEEDAQIVIKEDRL
ncbi:SurA N-terminal domain-containing protein [Gammaproteobacteria bacterium]|nr:SurA N-terminal domain-containing protein [Gammaproteobacteria bacterium]